MSRSIHFISKTIPGNGTPDGRYLPGCGSAVGIPPNSSRGNCTVTSDVKFLSLRCSYRHISSVCFASSSNYRRTSDFSRQNKHGFSGNRNRHDEEIDGYGDLEESEALTSKIGPSLSVSGNKKFEVTATLSPREKEIIELFEKVQAQLQERAAMKKERKVEDSQGRTRSKGSETVDSLLKLLRKHSVQQGTKNTNSTSNGGTVMLIDEGSCISISDSRGTVKLEMQESPSPHLSRPKSNFHRRSPVPEMKFVPVCSEDSVISVPHDISVTSSKGIILEPEADDIHEIKIEFDVEPLVSLGNAFDEMSENETSEISGSEDDIVADEYNLVEASDVSGMKLIELRALAKSRGLKRFSKLKKNELIELLSGRSSFCLLQDHGGLNDDLYTERY